MADDHSGFIVCAFNLFLRLRCFRFGVAYLSERARDERRTNETKPHSTNGTHSDTRMCIVIRCSFMLHIESAPSVCNTQRLCVSDTYRIVVVVVSLGFQSGNSMLTVQTYVCS